MTQSSEAVETAPETQSVIESDVSGRYQTDDVNLAAFLIKRKNWTLLDVQSDTTHRGRLHKYAIFTLQIPAPANDTDGNDTDDTAVSDLTAFYQASRIEAECEFVEQIHPIITQARMLKNQAVTRRLNTPG